MNASRTHRRTARGWAKALAAALVLVLTWVPSALAAPALPGKIQAAFIFRILAYDRKLASRAGAAVNVVVLYKDGDSGSATCQKDLADALGAMASKTPLSGKSVKVSPLPYGGGGKLKDDLSKLAASVVYICPGVGDVSAITSVTQARGALTFSAAENEVKSGVSIGIVRKDDKPSILVNLASSKAEGADLDSALLQLAVVLR